MSKHHNYTNSGNPDWSELRRAIGVTRRALASSNPLSAYGAFIRRLLAEAERTLAEHERQQRHGGMGVKN